MCLQPMLHLQAVLQRPPKMISLGKLGMLGFSNQPAFGQPAQANQGVRGAQPRIAPSQCNLQSLSDELDFTNAAAAKLDVETLLFTLTLEINFLFCQAHVVERVGHTDIWSKDAA